MDGSGHGLPMGWMRTLLLGDIGNRLDIEDTERDIALMRRANTRLKSSMAYKEARINRLEQELGRQKLAIEALTRFLIAKEVIEETDLEAFISEVDAEDGKVDGRLSIDPDDGRLKLNVPGK
jgi:hypothetical protein